MADIKISELEPTTDLEGLYTIGSDKNNLSKKVSLQFLKDAANYANEQGDYAKQAGDTVNGNVGVSDYPEFSASKSYVIGDIVRYNGVLYAFTANHAASAWNGSDVKATSINAITSGKLTELESVLVNNSYIKENVSELNPSHPDIFSDANSTSNAILYMKDGKESILTISSFAYSDYIAIPSGCRFLIMSNIYTWGAFFYDKNKNNIGFAKSNYDHKNALVGVPSTALYVRVNYLPSLPFALYAIFENEFDGLESAIGKNVFSYIGETQCSFVYISNGEEKEVANKEFNHSDFLALPKAKNRILTIPYSVTNNVIYYDNNKQVIGALVSKADINEPYEGILPDNASFIKVNYKIGEYYYAFVREKKSLELTRQKNIVDLNLYTLHDWIIRGDTGRWMYASGIAKCALIPVVQGDEISINTWRNICEYAFLSDTQKADGTLPSYVASAEKKVSQLDEKTNTKVVVPIGANYLYVLMRADTNYYSATIEMPTFVEGKPIKHIVNCLGDSITEGYISSGKWATPTWCQQLAMKTNNVVNNYGVSATSVCDGSSESFVDRLNKMSESEIDCLLIFGGTNDYGDKRATMLGTINDAPVQGTNFYASFKWLVESAINKYPAAMIGIITPMRRSDTIANSYGISIEDIVNAEIEVAKYYGIPYLDFYHNGGLNPQIAIHRTKWTSDGLHPNQSGIDKFLVPQFARFLETLVKYK